MAKRPSKKLSKMDYQVPGGPVVRADASPLGVIVVHPALGGRKGYAVTLAETGEIAGWRRLVKEARTLQKQLEELDWGAPGVRELAREIVLSKDLATPEPNKEVQGCKDQ